MASRYDASWWQWAIQFNLDGNFRTSVDNFWLSKNETYILNSNFDYEICSIRTDLAGSPVYIRLEDGVCVAAENPHVDVTGYDNEVTYILDLPDSILVIDEDFTGGEEFILPIGLDDDLCNNIPRASEPGDAPVFGRLTDGS